jgi:hypothetical protein
MGDPGRNIENTPVESANDHSSSNWGFLLFILLLTLAYLLSLFLKIPVLQELDGWNWPMKEKALPGIRLFGLVLVLILAGAYMIRKRLGWKGINLVLLIILGIFLQLSFAWMDGRGAVRDRMLKIGQGRIAIDAVRFKHKSMYEIVSRYQKLQDEYVLRHYPHSTKPPGPLAVYMAAERMSRLFEGLISEKDALQRLASFCSFLWPLLACLAILPLFYLGRMFLSDSDALVPPLLYLVLPSFGLMILCLDQCFYPILSVLCLFLIVHSMVRRSILSAFAAGSMMYLSLFFSYSLTSLPFFGAVFVLLELMRARMAQDGKSFKEISLPLLKVVALWGIGFVVAYALFLIVLRFELFSSWWRAMEFHEQWKKIDWTLGTTVYYGLIDLLELFMWIGIPVSLLFLKDVFDSLTEAVRRKTTLQGTFALSIFITMMVMAFFGRTAGEVARLWIYMMPFIVLIAARQVLRFSSSCRMVGACLLILQSLTILTFKAFQDAS